eukprot:PhF_6_TR26337/c1_g1_i2/m.37882
MPTVTVQSPSAQESRRPSVAEGEESKPKKVPWYKLLTRRVSDVMLDNEDIHLRLNRLAWNLRIGSFIQCGISMAVLALLVREPSDYGSQVRNISVIVTGVCGIAAGLYAAHSRKDYFARWFFQLQCFMMMILATYLFDSLEQENVKQDMCTAAVGNFAPSSDSCQGNLNEARAKIAFAVLGLINAFFNVMFALDFNDAINDSFAKDRIDARIVKSMTPKMSLIRRSTQRHLSKEAASSPKKGNEQSPKQQT